MNNDTCYANTGHGPLFSFIDIGLKDKVVLIEAETAFWSIIKVDAVPEVLSKDFIKNFNNERQSLLTEMNHLRFGLKPTAVYINPTDRCNFNCSYCYLPEDLRKNGEKMTNETLFKILDKVHGELTAKENQKENPKGNSNFKPQIIFHGSEPLLAQDVVFSAIENFSSKFRFGIQTNASLLNERSIEFLTKHGVGIGISLDAADEESANDIRKNWESHGAYDNIVKSIDALKGYPAFNVITTITQKNVNKLVEMVEFLHSKRVGIAMLNPVRCTQKGGDQIKADEQLMIKYFTAALDKSYELYKKTGHKLVIANFANVLAGIIAPTGRRLMCDISPCGGGRCFVAIAANGDIFPCSEFIGIREYLSGNILQDKDSIATAINHPAMKSITTRSIEKIDPCKTCSIRHFCGAACPAELASVHGSISVPSIYCKFIEEQIRYAFRLIANGEEDAFLWNSWKEETEETLFITGQVPGKF
ncbi:MAG: peptide-modifying radical SAM enzyme CbpB [Oligoflexia bacterium]|nr:peptide-modifying radical SAM enzyme CbpB [Oligoflexia bacterium]